MSTLGGGSFQYFINNNLSVGANALFSYDKVGDVSSTAFGGTAFGSLHLRLGLGAFLRPTLGIGALFGTSQADLGGGAVLEADQTSLLVRVALPFAYFPTKRIVLQAGPELNVSIGNVTPKMGGESQSFTNIASGKTGREGGHNYEAMIRKTPRKPIRVFLQDGANDLDNNHGNWPLANQQMAKALAFAGYDYAFVYGQGFHSGKHGQAILPDSLRWLWRDYKP